MSLFPESSELPRGRAVLISIKPKYADLIISGSKRVELRRSWPPTDTGPMVLYSSSPIQKLVGIAHVASVEERDIDGLWKIADANGSGVTLEELQSYMHGKRTGYGLMIGRVEVAISQVDPNDLFESFTPPQSFQYLSPKDFDRAVRLMFP